MAVYVGADRPLPTIDWDEAKPAFYVEALRTDEQAVRCQFTKPNVYYVGSHEGCGCGFQLGPHPDPDDNELPLRRASLDAFREYLRDSLTGVGDLELFACWEGDQEAEVVHRRRLTPDSLLDEAFHFLQRELSVMNSLEQ